MTLHTRASLCSRCTHIENTVNFRQNRKCFLRLCCFKMALCSMVYVYWLQIAKKNTAPSPTCHGSWWLIYKKLQQLILWDGPASGGPASPSMRVLSCWPVFLCLITSVIKISNAGMTTRVLIKQQPYCAPSKEQTKPKQEECGTGKKGKRQWGLWSHGGFKQQICYVYLKGQATRRAPKSMQWRLRRRSGTHWVGRGNRVLWPEPNCNWAQGSLSAIREVIRFWIIMNN